MTVDDDLKILKRRIARVYHQDGLIDVVTGSVLLGFGLEIATGHVAFLALAWMWGLLYLPVKNRLTFPRVGYVQIESEGKTAGRYVVMLALGTLSLLAVAGLILATRRHAWPAPVEGLLRTYHMLVIAAILAVPLAGGAIWTGLNRLWIYAATIPAVFLFGIRLGLEPPVYVIGLGSVILLIGLAFLTRFLMTHPVQEANEPSATS